MNLNREFVRMQTGSLICKRDRLQWLMAQNVRAEKVVNFGCNIGIETLALMWVLGANEAIGIDKNETFICQAQNTLTNLKDDIVKMQRMLHSFPQTIPERDKTWWSGEIPDFLKTDLLREEFRLDFRVCDITEPVGLPSSYYDLAFCDFVLHHIWFDSERENAQDDTQFAINEMTRVVKPSGVVAAYELIQFSDKPKLDFRSLFEQAGLEIVHTREIAVETTLHGPEITAEYLCGKR